jgi:hypothetical protein
VSPRLRRALRANVENEWLIVLLKVSDPRRGDSTTKLSNVSQSEPDPSLFQVPADYSITGAQQAATVQ